jgi:UDPglucose--hexose-1-phosphate uridylyltransferase
MPGPSLPHRRYNPLLDEWVLCSPQRLERPWQGQTEASPVERPSRYEPDCYLCPGNLRANGERNPRYEATFAFDNDFPALSPRLDAGTQPAEDDLLRAHPESGVCRVLCFSPRHDLTLSDMDLSGLSAVVDAWAGEVERLAADPRIAHVQVFENKGEMMGCSNPHPHCQIWATQHVPTGPARRLAAQRGYFEKHGRDLLGDYLARELSEGVRVVCRNEHWVALVPFWAAWPFETLLLPARRVADLPGLEAIERTALADVLGRLNRRYDNLFHCSFPYSMAWHGRPADGAPHPWWRLHATYYPPLLRSAAVRKFIVGYELAAEAQRDVTPEDAAARLRAAAETPLATDAAAAGRATS